MTARRWRLPPAPLHAGLATAAAAGLAGVVGLGMLAGLALSLDPWYPARAAGVFAAVMAAASLAARRQHPFPDAGPANQVTTMRVMLLAVAAGLAFEADTAARAWLVIGLTGVMAALDGVDGWLARRSRMASDFGARFDMETDALFILVLSVLVWRYDKAGAWVLGCGLMRYLFVASGWVLPWMAGALSPTRRGKAVAVTQFVGLGLALSPLVMRPASDVVAALTLAALTWSFAVDVGRLRRAV